MEYIQLTLDDYIQCKNEIKENLGGIVKSFVRIGWQLTRINASQAYKNDGYSSITEFAKAEYDMNPDGVSRFMSVYERYSVPGDTPELQAQYKEFKFAQLSEMLQIPEEDLPLIGPDTKRADIRELKKFNKENENNPDNLLNWQQEPQDKLAETILEYYKANKEILNDLYGSEACQTGNLKEMAEIVNPSGNKSFRKGTVFLMFRSFDKGIMVKEFGKSGPYDITWEQFFSITSTIFAEAAAGSGTWENYFSPEKSESEDSSVQETAEPEQAPEPAESRKDTSEAEAPEKTLGLSETEMDSEKCQKTAPTDETALRTENHSKKSSFAPAQKQEESETECQKTAQIPGQDSIENHPEYLPEPQEQENEPHKKEEIAPAQETEHDILDKPITRKELLDSLTTYGAANCIARALKDARNTTYSQLTNISFWEEWLNARVDRNGRLWID